MKEIVDILTKMVEDDDIQALTIKNDFEHTATVVSFYFRYVEFLPDEPFLTRVFPLAQHISIDGVNGSRSNGMMTLVFDGLLNKDVN